MEQLSDKIVYTCPRCGQGFKVRIEYPIYGDNEIYETFAGKPPLKIKIVDKDKKCEK